MAVLLELSLATKRETHQSSRTTITIVRTFVLRERLCEQWSASGSPFIPRMGPYGCRMTRTKWMLAHRWSSCCLSSPERYPRASRTSRMRLIWYARPYEKLHALLNTALNTVYHDNHAYKSHSYFFIAFKCCKNLTLMKECDAEVW